MVLRTRAKGLQATSNNLFCGLFTSAGFTAPSFAHGTERGSRKSCIPPVRIAAPFFSGILGKSLSGISIGDPMLLQEEGLAIVQPGRSHEDC